MLLAYVSEKQLDWDQHLSFLMMAYRASVQESTGFSPNKLMFGPEISSPLSTLVEPSKDSHFLSSDDHVKQLDTVL